MGFKSINGKLYPIGYFQDVVSKPKNIRGVEDSQAPSFKEILEKKIESNNSFKISNHAAERMKVLRLNEEDMKQIGKGINIAKEKGCKNSVIVFKDIAFIASIENNTLITAVEKERAKESIFTNVDSVVFL